MNPVHAATQPAEIVYPESDGKPMADNTLQFRWIVTIQGGLDTLFANRPDVFVAGDLLWYPVEGKPKVRSAPDVMVAVGRPKGYRGSYQQWREEGIAPQVVFEVLSPGNRAGKLVRKTLFYRKFGVEELYIYDPEQGGLSGWRRAAGRWREIRRMRGWVSPRLNVRFDLVANDLVLTGPDGVPFVSYLELHQQREAARQRAERLALKLRALGVDPDDDSSPAQL